VTIPHPVESTPGRSQVPIHRTLCSQAVFHAYLVYLFTHIWCTPPSFPRIFGVFLRIFGVLSSANVLIMQLIRYALYTYTEYLYGSPVAVARALEIAKAETLRREPPPPPTGEGRLRRSAGESGNVRRRGKEQHAAIFNFKAERGIDPADAPESIEHFCAEAGAALRGFGISRAETATQRLP